MFSYHGRQEVYITFPQHSNSVMVNTWHVCQRWHTIMFWVTCRCTPTFDNNHSWKHALFLDAVEAIGPLDPLEILWNGCALIQPPGLPKIMQHLLFMGVTHQQSQVMHFPNFWHIYTKCLTHWAKKSHLYLLIDSPHLPSLPYWLGISKGETILYLLKEKLY